MRTTLDPAAVAGTLPKVVAGLDPNLPVEDLRTMEQQVKDNVFLDRVISVLSASFAVLATLLAAVGLYGVLAYTVAQRTREIGLRMALGAEPGRVRGMVLRQVGVMAVIGGIIGLERRDWSPAAFARSLLFELQNHDPVVPRRIGDRPGRGGARRRSDPRASRVADRSDDGAALSVGREPKPSAVMMRPRRGGRPSPRAASPCRWRRISACDWRSACRASRRRRRRLVGCRCRSGFAPEIMKRRPW